MVNTTEPDGFNIVTCGVGNLLQTVTVTGELDLAAAPRLDVVLWAAIRAAAEVRLDCGGMSFIDSAGLKCLLTAIERAQDTGCRLQLVDMSAVLSQTLGRAGLTELFAIHAVQRYRN